MFLEITSYKIVANFSLIRLDNIKCKNLSEYPSKNKLNSYTKHFMKMVIVIIGCASTKLPDIVTLLINFFTILCNSFLWLYFKILK